MTPVASGAGRATGTVGYVLKMYPRYSETFIVNEVLAHEAAGMELRIFSLRPPVDTHFQDALSRVRSPVAYLPGPPKAAELWSAIDAAGHLLPGIGPKLEAARSAEVRDVYQALLLATAARHEGIGHLHAHFGTVATEVARLASAFAGISYTFTAHAKDIFHESVRPEELRRKLVGARATVTVSDYNVTHLRGLYGGAAERVERIYNGLDLGAFAYAPPRDRAPVIVGVGRLVEKKGFDDLLEACALLVSGGRQFRCVVIGDGPLAPRLRERIEQLDLRDRVELLGPRPQAEVIRTVRQAAVLAAPCVDGTDGNRDGLPTVLLEAMALGTPCVSTNVTGIPELVRHGQTGLQVPQHHPAALAAALGAVLDDRALALRLAERGRALIEREFDIHINTARLRALFGATGQPASEAA